MEGRKPGGEGGCCIFTGLCWEEIVLVSILSWALGFDTLVAELGMLMEENKKLDLNLFPGMTR